MDRRSERHDDFHGELGKVPQRGILLPMVLDGNMANLLRFVQIDPFPRLWARLQLTDEDLRALEMTIMTSPEKNPVIPGAGRLRKLRFSVADSNRGKSGSYRVYYANLSEHGTILLMAVLAKKDKSDLNQSDLHAVAQVIGQIEKKLEQGVIR